MPDNLSGASVREPKSENRSCINTFQKIKSLKEGLFSLSSKRNAGQRVHVGDCRREPDARIGAAEGAAENIWV